MRREAPTGGRLITASLSLLLLITGGMLSGCATTDNGQRSLQRSRHANQGLVLPTSTAHALASVSEADPDLAAWAYQRNDDQVNPRPAVWPWPVAIVEIERYQRTRDFRSLPGDYSYTTTRSFQGRLHQ